MDHIKIIGSFVALILGAFVIFNLYQEKTKHPRKYLNSIYNHTLATNGLILLLFFAKYLDVNITPKISIDSNPLLFASSISIMSLLLVVSNHFLIKASYEISNKTVPALHHRIALSLYLSIILTSLVLIIAGIYSITVFDIFILLFLFLFLMFIYEFIILIVVLTRGIKSYISNKRQVQVAFAALYISRYFIPPVVGIINFIIELNKITLMINGRIFLIYLNLIPLIWLKKYYRKITLESNEKESIDVAIKRVLQKYSISKREEEILRLILEGKTNEEITKILFISTHTVKNHIYSIFQKLGINSRYQLIKFISHKDL
ncbi:MAG: helix-turn-helix transcriptional regulator [Acidobacteria bacterium]|nr:helix-turn-helix transcriptional regulator [Acidobacteriota bacterium]